MIRWSHLPVVAALVLLTACADSAIGQTSLTPAQLNKRAALTACTAQAYAQRPATYPGQLYSLPGQPRRGGAAWQNQINGNFTACMIAKGYGNINAKSNSNSSSNSKSTTNADVS